MKLKHALAIVCTIGFSGVALAQVSDQAINGGTQASDKTIRNIQKVDDMKITRSVHDMLSSDRTLSAESKNISVMTDSGVVILKGMVPTTAERSRIEELAKRAPGVRSVQNMTELQTQRSE